MMAPGMGRVRTSGRGGIAHGALAGTLALLYLVLSLNALTCALHHGLYGACPHHMGGAAHHAMPDMAGGSGMHAGHDGPAPADAPTRAAVGLCHCLDNLAAEPPADLLAAAPVPPAAATFPAPAAHAATPAAGTARPRAPPSETA